MAVPSRFTSGIEVWQVSSEPADARLASAVPGLGAMGGPGFSPGPAGNGASICECRKTTVMFHVKRRERPNRAFHVKRFDSLTAMFHLKHYSGRTPNVSRETDRLPRPGVSRETSAQFNPIVSRETVHFTRSDVSRETVSRHLTGMFHVKHGTVSRETITAGDLLQPG
jgi:hypothetical protein